MSEGRVERRLAAILAVDVAGYSRLMGEDEEGSGHFLNGFDGFALYGLLQGLLAELGLGASARAQLEERIEPGDTW